ncbi:hypothetical protein DTO195F2_3422 [Paecilomyces variotii]|nr:hypothetical protein DTO195F2_3422 [Paecilomyces variotii]KAJ9373228.1 hypothetical protein DTO282E5_1964 [Paecilomyces variotii]
MKTAFKISWDSTIFDRPAALHFFFFAPLPCIIIVLLCVTNASGSVVKGEKKRGEKPSVAPIPSFGSVASDA